MDRVEVIHNGEIIRVFEDCLSTDAETCIPLPNTEVMNLDTRFSVEITGDSWFTVTALGVKGKNLSPVYSTKPLPRFGFNESLTGFLGSLPLLNALVSEDALVPSAHPVLPFALTNPIWVSTGDDCYTPPEGSQVPSWIDCDEEVHRGFFVQKSVQRRQKSQNVRERNQSPIEFVWRSP